MAKHPLKLLAQHDAQIVLRYAGRDTQQATKTLIADVKSFEGRDFREGLTAWIRTLTGEKLTGLTLEQRALVDLWSLRECLFSGQNADERRGQVLRRLKRAEPCLITINLNCGAVTFQIGPEDLEDRITRAYERDLAEDPNGGEEPRSPYIPEFLAQRYYLLRLTAAGNPVDLGWRDVALRYLIKTQVRHDNDGFAAGLPVLFEQIIQGEDTPHREVDHVLSLDDFMAWSALDPDETLIRARLEALPETRISNYSFLEPLSEQKALSEAGIRISGITMWRTDNVISWFAALALPRQHPASADPDITGTVDAPGWPEGLLLYVWGRSTINIRDPYIFGIVIPNEANALTQNGVTWMASGPPRPHPDYLTMAFKKDRFEQIDDNGEFEHLYPVINSNDFMKVMAQFCTLPVYFSTRVAYVTQEPSRVAAAQKPTVETDEFGPITEQGFRVVRTLKPIRLHSETGPRAPRREPQYRTELDGFYRPLAPGQIGRDEAGRPLLGKTWVRAHARYKSKPVRPRTVLAKQPIMAALETASSRAADGTVWLTPNPGLSHRPNGQTKPA